MCTSHQSIPKYTYGNGRPTSTANQELEQRTKQVYGAYKNANDALKNQLPAEYRVNIHQMHKKNVTSHDYPESTEVGQTSSTKNGNPQDHTTKISSNSNHHEGTSNPEKLMHNQGKPNENRVSRVGRLGAKTEYDGTRKRGGRDHTIDICRHLYNMCEQTEALQILYQKSQEAQICPKFAKTIQKKWSQTDQHTALAIENCSKYMQELSIQRDNATTQLGQRCISLFSRLMQGRDSVVHLAKTMKQFTPNARIKISFFPKTDQKIKCTTFEIMPSAITEHHIQHLVENLRRYLPKQSPSTTSLGAMRIMIETTPTALDASELPLFHQQALPYSQNLVEPLHDLIKTMHSTQCVVLDVDVNIDPLGQDPNMAIPSDIIYKAPSHTIVEDRAPSNRTTKFADQPENFDDHIKKQLQQDYEALKTLEGSIEYTVECCRDRYHKTLNAFEYAYRSYSPDEPNKQNEILKYNIRLMLAPLKHLLKEQNITTRKFFYDKNRDRCNISAIVSKVSEMVKEYKKRLRVGARPPEAIKNAT